MKTLARAALLSLSLLALGGCDAILGTNLFAGLVDIEPSDIPRNGSLSDYEDLSDSPSFFDALSGDDALRDDVVTQLAGIALATSDPAVAQEAAALAGEVLMKTTSAGAIANGIVDAALAGALDYSDPEAMIAALIPPEALSSIAAFRETIGAFIDAAAAYDLLGQNLIGGGYTDTVNYGEVAQYAAISLAMDALMTENLYPDSNALADDLFLLFDALPGNDPPLTLLPPTSTFLGSGSPLEAIFLEAGLETDLFE